jgi:hypothetical protein
LNKGDVNVGNRDEVTIDMRDYSYKDPLVPNRHCLLIASNTGLRRTDLGASFLIGKRITFSVSAGWLDIEEGANCTVRTLADRIPVVPVEGQLTKQLNIPSTSDGSATALALVIFLLVLVAIGMGLIVRKSVLYVPIAKDAGQEDEMIARAVELSQSSPRRRLNSSQLE